MKTFIWILMISLLVWTHAIAAGKIIDDNDASKYMGEFVTVKGRVANVFQSQKGNIFLNFGKPYPNQTFSAVIFSKDAAKFGNIGAFEGKTFVVTGVVQSYKGKSEIILKSHEYISSRREGA
jgi:DNA/RNA endonuclease YhcR with UshA esterase domain